MRISDWSSDVCSSDLGSTWILNQSKDNLLNQLHDVLTVNRHQALANHSREVGVPQLTQIYRHRRAIEGWNLDCILLVLNNIEIHPSPHRTHHGVIQESCRSDEPTSELQSLMRNSSAVYCLKKK